MVTSKGLSSGHSCKSGLRSATATPHCTITWVSRENVRDSHETVFHMLPWPSWWNLLQQYKSFVSVIPLNDYYGAIYYRLKVNALLCGFPWLGPLLFFIGWIWESVSHRPVFISPPKFSCLCWDGCSERRDKRTWGPEACGVNVLPVVFWSGIRAAAID